ARLICSIAARAAPCAPVFAGNAAGHGLHDNQTTTGAHDAHGQPCGPSARPRGARMALWLTLAVLVGAIYLFVTERLRVDVVALLVMTALVVTGVLTVPEGLSGFSSQATIMV